MSFSHSVYYLLLLGFCSDGEFNSMRNRGYTRPISVFLIRSQVRAKYARLSESTMLAMLTPIGNNKMHNYTIVLNLLILQCLPIS